MLNNFKQNLQRFFVFQQDNYAVKFDFVINLGSPVYWTIDM